VAKAAGGQALVNQEATKLAVSNALLLARRVHLATHGTSNAHAPSFDSLAVWPDDDNGRLAAYELLALDLAGLELVTLSACETALVRFDVADNLRGLAATMLRAGVQTVIGTMWAIESSTSATFFTSLYTQLGQSATVGDAFTGAQSATRAAHPAYRDWGAFKLMGTW
jgi:CHAT domain-containing protein